VWLATPSKHPPNTRHPTPLPDFYPAMVKPNVSLHTQAVAEATPTGLRLADGTHLELDTIVCATGACGLSCEAAVVLKGLAAQDAKRSP
jgi:cation diffusion facilitator CzcD-associated flavoprotein CzcO